MIGAGREEWFEAGKNPTMASLGDALLKKYGATPSINQSNPGQRFMRWIYDPMGRLATETSPLHNQCAGTGASGGVSLSPDCGIVVEAHLTPLPDNPDLARSMEVGGVDQANGYELITATEQNLEQAAQPSAATNGEAQAGMNGRTGELQNPDNNAVVFLYYDLAGIKPVVDQWVEKDNRLVMAKAIDKAALRETIRSEFEAGLASVRGVGLIRITLNNANLSDYDPTYGEFTIRALSPSSEIPFSALGQKVAIRFANGRNAQIWKVPAAEAQAIRDKVGYSSGGYPNLELDLLLRIKSVQSGPADGTIMTDILEYEMRDTQGGAIINRARLAQ